MLGVKLGSVGAPQEGETWEEAERRRISKGYKLALIQFHPDRAARRAAAAADPVRAALESEETYKLIQNLHEQHTILSDAEAAQAKAAEAWAADMERQRAKKDAGRAERLAKRARRAAKEEARARAEAAARCVYR